MKNEVWSRTETRRANEPVSIDLDELRARKQCANGELLRQRFAQRCFASARRAVKQDDAVVIDPMVRADYIQRDSLRGRNEPIPIDQILRDANLGQQQGSCDKAQQLLLHTTAENQASSEKSQAAARVAEQRSKRTNLSHKPSNVSAGNA